MNTNMGKWSRSYEMVVSRKRRLLGFGGLDERVLVGLWTDAAGRRRRADLVGLGAASDIHGAIRLAMGGLERHPEGTRGYRMHRDWLTRLLAAQRLEREADERYRALVVALAGDVPVYEPAATAAE